jgi:hypothetical protein
VQLQAHAPSAVVYHAAVPRATTAQIRNLPSCRYAELLLSVARNLECVARALVTEQTTGFNLDRE